MHFKQCFSRGNYRLIVAHRKFGSPRSFISRKQRILFELEGTKPRSQAVTPVLQGSPWQNRNTGSSRRSNPQSNPKLFNQPCYFRPSPLPYLEAEVREPGNGIGGNNLTSLSLNSFRKWEIHDYLMWSMGTWFRLGPLGYIWTVCTTMNQERNAFPRIFILLKLKPFTFDGFAC